MRERLRIVIAEDNYLVREGTRRLLEDSGEVEVIAAVGDAQQLRDAVRRLTPDAVLTDIRMPPGHHMEGVDAAHAIRAEHPGVGVAVLSQHIDESYAFALLRDGAAGLAYLLKDRLDDPGRPGPSAARSGTRWICDRPAGRRRPRRPAHPLVPDRAGRAHAPRTRRAPGNGRRQTNAAIEQVLHLSTSSVEKHVNSIFGKLRLADEPVHRRVTAVLTFLREQSNA